MCLVFALAITASAEESAVSPNHKPRTLLYFEVSKKLKTSHLLILWMYIPQ